MRKRKKELIYTQNRLVVAIRKEDKWKKISEWGCMITFPVIR